MSGQGIAQILVYIVVLDRARLPARPLHGARLQRRRLRDAAVASAGSARSSAASSASCASTARASRTGRATRRRARLQHRRSSPSSTALRAPGPPVPEPGPPARASRSHIALNTTASFVTNTNWQYYGGEYTMSYLSQMAGLAVQNFVSAAVGMAVLAAVVRGIARRSRSDARQLLARPLPLARLHPAAARDRPRRDPDLAGRRRRPSTRHATAHDAPGRARRRSRAARPPPRSRSSSSARTAAASTTRTRPFPFENPNGLTNFLEMLAILLIPAGQVFMFGKMVGARRHALGGIRSHARRLRRSASRSTCRPSSTARRCCATRA